MIDAHTAYRWDFNLFVAIAAPLLLVGLVMSGMRQLPIRLT